MKPEQKLASIRIFAERAVKMDPNASLNAQWLLNHIDFQSAPQEDTDMVDQIKNQMQLHAADCMLNEKVTTNQTRCTCWLENPNEAVYTIPETKIIYRLKAKDQYTALHGMPDFTSRQDAIDHLCAHTMFSIYPENNLYWGNFYDIKEKEITTA